MVLNRGLFMTPFSKVPGNSSKVIYRYQTAIETSTIPATIPGNIAVLTLMVASVARNWVKRARTYISYNNGDRKLKGHRKGKLGKKNSFLKPLLQNSKALTSHGDLINQKMGQKGPNLS